MKTLRIKDQELIKYNNRESYLLTFDLIDILHECEGYSNRLWVAWSVDCIGSQWCQIFTEAPNEQIQLSFYDLLDYGRDVTQTLDGYFFAVAAEQNVIKDVPQIAHSDECLQVSDLIIHVFDSSFWEVTSNDEALLARLAIKFKETTMYS